MSCRSSLSLERLVLIAAASAALNSPALAARREDGEELRLAALAAAEVKQKLPPAASTVVLRPMDARVRDGAVFSLAFDRALRSAGYAVADASRAPNGAEVVSYAVTPALNGYVVRLNIQGQTTARFYRPNDAGALASAGPATVMEAE